MQARIRLATAADAEAIAAVYGHNVECSHCTFEEVPPTADEIARRMANPIHPWLVADDESRLLGFASTSPMRDRAAYRWSIETGIYLAPDAQRQGCGRRLMEALLGMLAEQGFVTAIAGIALPNDASVALHEKLGFALVGIERGVGFKLGRWVDVARFQIDLAERSSAPAEPRPYIALASVPGEAAPSPRSDEDGTVARR